MNLREWELPVAIAAGVGLLLYILTRKSGSTSMSITPTLTAPGTDVTALLTQLAGEITKQNQALASLENQNAQGLAGGIVGATGSIQSGLTDIATYLQQGFNTLASPTVNAPEVVTSGLTSILNAPIFLPPYSGRDLNGPTTSITVGNKTYNCAGNVALNVRVCTPSGG